MNKSIICLLSLLISINVLAEEKKEIVNCTITEPFLDLSWNPNTKEIKMTSVEFEGEKLIASNVTVAANYSNAVLFDSKGKEVMIIGFEGGSDGMSDLEYPMSVKYKGHYGACSTETFKPWDGFEMRQNVLPVKK